MGTTDRLFIKYCLIFIIVLILIFDLGYLIYWIGTSISDPNEFENLRKYLLKYSGTYKGQPVTNGLRILEFLTLQIIIIVASIIKIKRINSECNNKKKHVDINI